MFHDEWIRYSRSPGASSLVYGDEKRRIFIEVFEEDGAFVGKIVHWSDDAISSAEICRKQSWPEAWAAAKAIAWGVHFALNESKEVA